MSSLTRWDPTSEMTSLRDAVNQLMERAVMRPGFGWGTLGSGHGPMNVFELGGSYHCQVLLPGASPQDIDLTVRQNTLTLKGKIAEPLTEEQQKTSVYLLREFGAGGFSRAITFPKDVRGDAIEAHYENGILTIVVPIAEHAQARRITIQAVPGKQPQSQIVDGQPATAQPTAEPELVQAGKNGLAS